MDKFNSLNFATNNKGGGSRLRKTKLEDMNFNANDLNMNNLISNLNSLGNLNPQSNVSSLPPDLFSLANLNNLGSFNSLTNLNSLNNFNADQQFQQTSPSSMHHHPPPSNPQFNKNAVTSEFTNQSSMLYPNHFPFYQQSSSKLTLSSSNIIAPPPSSSLGFSPYLTAAIQQSLLNHNFLQNNLLQQQHQISPQQQQLFVQQSLNNLTNLTNLGNLNHLNGLNGLNGLNSLNELNNLSSFKDYLKKPEFNDSLNNGFSSNHLNQFNKNLNLLNENFLNNNSNLIYPNNQINQLSNNDFNLILNTNPPPTSQQTQAHSKPFKKQKLEIANKTDLKEKLKLKKDFELNIDEFKEKELINFKINKFEELKVQTTNEHNSIIKKLDDDKKFSPDSSTELITTNNKQKSPIHLTNLTNSLNNQSPVITSTKSSSSEHSASPNTLHSSLNTSCQSSKLLKDLDKNFDKDLANQDLKSGEEFVKDHKFIKEEFTKDEFIKDRFMNTDYIKEEFIKKEVKKEGDAEEEEPEEEEINTDHEDDDELSSVSSDNNHELRIDLNNELTNDSNNESFTSREDNLIDKKSVKTEDLYSLILNKSFQPSIHNFKEVSLDRISFDEDEEEEDKSPININFKNLIDNDLNPCSDNNKDDEFSINKSRKNSKSKRRRKELDNTANDPWSIRRSERIFLNEALSNNSANFNLDKQNKDFKLTLKDLEEPQRILIQVDDLLYSGLATKDELSGKYCISLDDIECSKNNQILTFEKLKEEAIVEIKPKSIDQLFENCRVCALWSRKTKYLYPGRVAKLTSGSTSSLNSTNSKKDSVLVHFDDGDKTKISLDEIRLLPQDFELKSTGADEENSLRSNKQPNEEKKVEKLKIRLINKNNYQETSKKKKKKHHHKKHKRHSNDCERNSDTEINDKLNERKEEEEDDEWFTTFQNIQQWTWYGNSAKKTPKIRPSKIFYNAIVRGDEIIRTNDCAVFLSAGKASLPFIGRVVKMWENANENMVVSVKWFYHPEETKKPPKLQDSKHALFSSEHYDDNDVQTISHRVEVLSTYKEYLAKKKEIKNSPNYNSDDDLDIYYLCGVYDPGKGQILSLNTSKKDAPFKK